MRRSPGVKLSAALWMLAACATPIQEQAWIEVATPNFTVASSLGEVETLELVRDLEWFRALVYQLTNAPQRASPVPTRIVAFASESQFAPYRSRREVKGYFLSGLRWNDVAIVKSRELDPKTLIRHEYVHFLLRNASPVLYPRWYDEGLAEFLSTAEIRGDRIARLPGGGAGGGGASPGGAPRHLVAPRGPPRAGE